ncbi:MAG: ATP-binding protein [Planctomycetota bacterium]|nr:ATP-binding protein [Planctomycetota bacterium]
MPSRFMRILKHMWFPTALAVCATLVFVVSNATIDSRVDSVLKDPDTHLDGELEKVRASVQDIIREYGSELLQFLSSREALRLYVRPEEPDASYLFRDESDLFRVMADIDRPLMEKEIGLLVVDNAGRVMAWCGWLKGVDDRVVADILQDRTSSTIVKSPSYTYLVGRKPDRGMPPNRASWSIVALVPIASIFDDREGFAPERALRIRRLCAPSRAGYAPASHIEILGRSGPSAGQEHSVPDNGKSPPTEDASTGGGKPVSRVEGLSAEEWTANPAESSDRGVRTRVFALGGNDEMQLGTVRISSQTPDVLALALRREVEDTRNMLLIVLTFLAACWLLRLLMTPGPTGAGSASLQTPATAANETRTDTAGSTGAVFTPRHLLLRAVGSVLVLLLARAALRAADFPGALVGDLGFGPQGHASMTDVGFLGRMFCLGSICGFVVTGLFALAVGGVIAHFIRIAGERRIDSGRDFCRGSVLGLASAFALAFGAGVLALHWLVRFLFEHSRLEFFTVAGGPSISVWVLLAEVGLLLFAAALVVALGRLAWLGTLLARSSYTMPACVGVLGLLVVFSVCGFIGSGGERSAVVMYVPALLALVLPLVFQARRRAAQSTRNADASIPVSPRTPGISIGQVSLAAVLLVFPCLYYGEESYRTRLLSEKVVQLGGRLEEQLDELVSQHLGSVASSARLRIALEKLSVDKTSALSSAAMEEWFDANLADLGVESYVGIRSREGKLISEFSTGVPSIRKWWRGPQRSSNVSDHEEAQEQAEDGSWTTNPIADEPEWRTWQTSCRFAGRDLQVHAGAALVMSWSGSGAGGAARETVGQVVLAVVSPYESIRTPAGIRPPWPWHVPQPGERQPKDYSVAEFQFPTTGGSAGGEKTMRTNDPQTFSGIVVPVWAMGALAEGKPTIRGEQLVGTTSYELHFGIRKVHNTPLGYIALARTLPDDWDAVACFLALVFVFVCVSTVVLGVGRLGASVLLMPARGGLTMLRPFDSARWGMARKLVVAITTISFVPILVLATFTGRLMAERGEGDRKERILRRAEIGRAIFKRLYLGELPHGESSSPTAVAAQDAADETSAVVGEDIDIFESGRLLLSSRPEAFTAGLASRFLPPTLYHGIVLSSSEHSVDDVGAITAGVALGGTKGTSAVMSVSAVPEPFTALGIRSKTVGVMLGAYALLILAAWWVGGLAARKISQPLERLVHATERISRGDLDFKLGEPGGSDVGRLVVAFDRMTADLKISRLELARAAREATWREVARQVAHEVKNPLTPIKLSAQHLLRAYDDKAADFGAILADCARTIVAEVELLERIATSFSNVAKLPECKLENVDLNATAREALATFETVFRTQEIVAESRLDERLPAVRADRDWMKRVFTNLIKNAVEAMPGKGRIVVSSWRSNDGVKVAFEDTGLGIPPEVKSRVFEPYFSTKDRGTGLGLSICKRIVDDLGGKIEIESVLGRGTRVEVWLPEGGKDSPPVPQDMQNGRLGDTGSTA